MKPRCVVNFAKPGRWPNAWYPRGQQRLRESLADTGWDGITLCFNEECQVNAPSHSLVPYGFKAGALNTAARDGYTSLLWCDASVFAIRPLSSVFAHIEEHGHLFFPAGFNCAQWTNDRALRILGLSRDEAEKMPMLMALCFGLDLQHERSRKFLEEFSRYILETDAACGSWDNANQQESADPRCLGHRHDQSIASILAARHGMALTEKPRYLDYYGPALYQYGQNNDMGRIGEETVLLAQGMMS